MAELRRRFSDTAVEHMLRPRNLRSMTAPDGRGEAVTSCGDRIEICLRLKGDRIGEVSFQFEGCATTMACASMAVSLLAGKSLSEAWAISAEAIIDGLDGLPRENAHCAELAEKSLRAALINQQNNRKDPWKKLYQR